MPRVARSMIDGGFYHVLNRGNARADIFLKTGDFEAFLRVVDETQARHPVDPRPFGHAGGPRSWDEKYPFPFPPLTNSPAFLCVLRASVVNRPALIPDHLDPVISRVDDVDVV